MLHLDKQNCSVYFRSENLVRVKKPTTHGMEHNFALRDKQKQVLCLATTQNSSLKREWDNAGEIKTVG
jgi:hypothetical protein